MLIHPLYSINGQTFLAESLTLTGLFRDYPGSLPWNGTASVGNSSSHNITTGSTSTPGPIINSRKTANFDGTQSITTADNISVYFTTVNTFSGWVLFNTASVTTNNTVNKFVNQCLLCYHGASFFYVYLRSTGNIGFGIFNGTANVEVETTFNIGKWQLVEFSISGGTTMSIRCSNDKLFATNSTAAGMGASAAPIDIGVDPGGTNFYNGIIAEIGLYNNLLTAQNFDDIRYNYIPRRYGIVV